MSPLAHAEIALAAVLLPILLIVRVEKGHGWSARLAGSSAALASVLLIEILMRLLPIYGGLPLAIRFPIIIGAAALWIASAFCAGYWRRWPDIALGSIAAAFGFLLWLDS